MAIVLVVEDHPDAREAVRAIFEVGGHDVRVAATVAEAIDACTAAASTGRLIDLMILDVSLPDGDGVDVLAATTPQGTAPKTTIALTGWDDKAIAQRCRDAGCADVLLKPVSARQLLALGATATA